jgi:hypothetical protein
VVTHPASGDFGCEAGQKYLKELKKRRVQEMEMLNYLTGKGYSDWDVVMNTDEEKSIPASASYQTASLVAGKKSDRDNTILLAVLGLVGLGSVIGLGKRRI